MTLNDSFVWEVSVGNDVLLKGKFIVQFIIIIIIIIILPTLRNKLVVQLSYTLEQGWKFTICNYLLEWKIFPHKLLILFIFSETWLICRVSSQFATA